MRLIKTTDRLPLKKDQDINGCVWAYCQFYQEYSLVPAACLTHDIWEDGNLMYPYWLPFDAIPILRTAEQLGETERKL